MRSPESRFLLDSLAAGGVRAAAPLNWDRFLDCAFDNGVGALAYARLQESGRLDLLPQQVAKTLHQRYACVGLRNSGCLEELGRVLAALRAASVRTIVLKGAALAESTWRNVALRSMRDFDLMVHRAQVDQAGAVLRRLDYRPDERYAREDWYRREHHHSAPMAHPTHGLAVEIHWNILAPNALFDFSPDRLWERAVETRVAGADALTLAPEDHVLHLCLHTACDDPFQGKIRSLLDITEILRTSHAGLNWDQLVEEAVTGGYARFLYYPLFLASRLLRAPVPTNALESLRRAGGMGIAEDRLVKACAAGCLLASRDGAPGVADWRLCEACEILLFTNGTARRAAAFSGRLLSRLGHTLARPWTARRRQPPPRLDPAPKDGESP